MYLRGKEIKLATEKITNQVSIFQLLCCKKNDVTQAADLGRQWERHTCHFCVAIIRFSIRFIYLLTSPNNLSIESKGEQEVATGLPENKLATAPISGQPP